MTATFGGFISAASSPGDPANGNERIGRAPAPPVYTSRHGPPAGADRGRRGVGPARPDRAAAGARLRGAFGGGRGGGPARIVYPRLRRAGDRREDAEDERPRPGARGAG